MLFSDQFVASLDEDPVGKTQTICETALNSLSDNEQSWTNGDYEALLEAFILLQEMNAARIVVAHGFPLLQNEIGPDCIIMRDFLISVRQRCEILNKENFVEKTRSRLRLAMGKVFQYEFTEGDLSRVQQLLNELRVQIGNADFLGDEHRQRLLARLEKLQAEVHKKVSNLDRFWGIAGDAGIALRKFGEDAKPIVDRVRELTEIVWRTQAHAEGLPSGSGMPPLGHDPKQTPSDKQDAPASPPLEA